MLLATNVVAGAGWIYRFFVSSPGYDWAIYVEAGHRAWSGGLYDWGGTYAWSYSPLLAFVFALIAPIGYLGWSALHVAALAALRDGWLTLLTLLSWPFWADVFNGNTLVFVFVAAVLAIRRNGIGTGAYLLLCLLMPRPLMLPVLAWVLWRQPQWRWRFAAMIAVYGLLLLLTGQGFTWLNTLVNVSGAAAASSRDLGPGVLIGGWWTVLGAALAIVFTVRGRLGWASLAASPYWLEQYLLMLLLELAPVRPSQASETRTYAGGIRGLIDRYRETPR